MSSLLYGDPSLQNRDIEQKSYRKDVPINEFYEIERTCSWIKEHNYKNIALQLPDYLLGDSTQIIKLLKNNLNNDEIYFFVLADTNYGSCCVDEVAASHMLVDAIIHYGHSCLSRTKRFPVLYIFGKQNIDIHDLYNHIIKLHESNPSSNFLLTYDVSYSHSVDSIKELFDESFPLVITKHCNPQLEERIDEYSFYFCGRYANLLKDTSIESYIFIHIGEEGSYLTNLMMNYNSNTFYSYYPHKKEFRKEDIQVNKHLMRRFYLIEKAKDSDIFGIVVGTLSVDKYLDILEKIKKMIKNAGKCFYTMIVGKLNVPKLANFPEIDMFVLVSCPENSLIDSKEFYKPIITPYELEIALIEGKEWTNKYSTNFALLLNENDDLEKEKPIEDEEEVRYSLVSGQLKRNHKRNIILELDDNEDDDPSIDKNIVLRDKMELMSLEGPSASTFFLNRTYQGLQQNLGEDEATIAVEGKFGTARSYKKIETEDIDDIEEI